MEQPGHIATPGATPNATRGATVPSGDTANLGPARHRKCHPVWAALGVAVAFFLAIAPTLTMLELSSGSENLNVATVLEIRRGGPWMIPTLRGVPRVTKPPLTAWTSAAFVPTDTVASLSNPDVAARDAAYARLAWQVRWPSLALSCVTLALVFEMGRLLAGARAGVTAALVAGSTILFLRYGRIATTDVQLTLWVTLANVMMLHAALRGRWWAGCTVAGVAVGLAIMSKGPVALVQTLAPMAAWGAFLWWQRRRAAKLPNRGLEVLTDGSSAAPVVPVHVPGAKTRAFRSSPWGAVATGMLLTLLVAVPWFAWVLHRTPNIAQAWASEVTRVGATDLAVDPWWGYATVVASVAPWSLFFIVGVVMATQATLRGDRKLAAAMMLLVVPIVVMSFFKDKPERYLQPMLGPASVVAAVALVGQRRPWRDRAPVDRGLAIAHGAIVSTIVIGAPVAGAAFLKTVDGTPWYALPTAIGAAVVGVGLLAAFAICSVRRGRGLTTGSAVLMLLVQPFFLVGYARSHSGRAELKPIADQVWATAQDADVFFVTPARPRGVPTDLLVYLNRLVPTVPSMAAIPKSTRAQAAVLLQRGDEPFPGPPSQWTLGKTVRWGERRWWHLMIRPAVVTHARGVTEPLANAPPRTYAVAPDARDPAHVDPARR